MEIRGADDAVVLAVTRDLESRLLRLLPADTAVAGELRRVVSELEQLEPGPQEQVSIRQRARASGHSTVIQVAGDGKFGDLPLTTAPKPAGAAMGVSGGAGLLRPFLYGRGVCGDRGSAGWQGLAGSAGGRLSLGEELSRWQ